MIAIYHSKSRGVDRVGLVVTRLLDLSLLFVLFPTGDVGSSRFYKG